MKQYTARGIIQDKIERLVKQEKLRQEFKDILDAVEQQAVAAHELRRLQLKTGEALTLDKVRGAVAQALSPRHNRTLCGGSHERRKLTFGGGRTTVQISCDAFDSWQARAAQFGGLDRFIQFRQSRGYKDGL